ncbi:hypothetical protein [Nocardioides lijunqiniae]|uniref:hypothetical protein n=1 Tax=Nocardioides lijunqiniae TaxID=2760832 RepID=UPI00187778FD|nr:hypothetical protein [Nocardioides lijunqiniae]
MRDDLGGAPDPSADEVWPTLLGVTGFAVLTLLALTEHFAEVPAAAVAFVAAWRVSRW